MSSNKLQKRKDNVSVSWWSRAMMVMFMDIMIIIGSYFLALWMRFDFVFSNIPVSYLEGYVCAMRFWFWEIPTAV